TPPFDEVGLPAGTEEARQLCLTEMLEGLVGVRRRTDRGDRAITQVRRVDERVPVVVITAISLEHVDHVRQCDCITSLAQLAYTVPVRFTRNFRESHARVPSVCHN